MSDNLSPKISVVIPLYNKVQYISRALDSVLSQTFQDFEVIVVGGNSIDGSEDVVRTYCDSRIHLIDETGHGVSAARNQGVDCSRAELIAFLDADDAWSPSFLDEMLSLHRKWPKCGIYGSGFRRIYPSYIEEVVTNDNDDVLISEYFKYLCKYGNIIVAPSSLMVSKGVFYRYGGFDSLINWGEDRDFYCRVALVQPIAYHPAPLSNVYKETANNSSSVTSGLDSTFLKRVIGNGNCIVRHKEYSYIIEYSNSLMLHISYLYARGGNKKKALFYLFHISDKMNLQWFFYLICIIFPNNIVDIMRRYGQQTSLFRILHRIVCK